MWAHNTIIILDYMIFLGSSKYGPKVPVSLVFPGPTFCKSGNILLLVAAIPPNVKKVKTLISF